MIPPISCSEKVEACGDNPVAGYTEDYVPEASASLDAQYDAELVPGDDLEFIDSNFSVNCTLYLGKFLYTARVVLYSIAGSFSVFCLFY